jgi:hypothetical protein
LSKHEHFKELCALAPVGEAPREKVQELNDHLASCSDCRQAYSEFLRLNAGLISLTEQEDDALIESCREAVRASVVQSVASVKPHITATGSQLALAVPRPPFFDRTRVVRVAGIAAACIMCVWLGVQYQRRFVSQEPIGARNLQFVQEPELKATDESQLRVLEARAAELDDSLRAEKRRNAFLEQILGDRAQQLFQTRQENASLEQRINATGDELHQMGQDKAGLEKRIAELGQELAGLQSQLAARTEELKQKENAKSSDSATLVALRQQVQELTEKLNSQSESLNRARDLLAGGREIRDIVGARNLHIVDVYDTDGKGRTKKPFARAFYTEGKSLVFYAYDLPMHPEVGAYVAWGQKNGSKAAIRNLGKLVNDDQGQRRWMFRFNDPDVLAEIDSVFITLETAGDALRPSGKRMLTAYLDDRVNHP